MVYLKFTNHLIKANTRLIYQSYDNFYCLFQFPGRDVIAQAQSGTGKTATFAVSILQQLDVGKRDCQALVLAPTRELAQQIQKVVQKLSVGMLILVF